MDFYSERHVKKTRKDHKCFGCREIVLKGSEVFYTASVWQGDFGTYYLCPPCHNYLVDNPEVFAEGFCEGDIGEDRDQNGSEGGD